MNIDPTVFTILKIVLSILIFFTILFHSWKIAKDGPFVRLMLTRTYSWWAIFFIYIIFFCIYPPIGQVGLCLLAMLGFREIVRNSTTLIVSKELLSLCYLLIITQFIATSFSHNLIALTFLPTVGLLVITVFCILFESVQTFIHVPPFIIWTLMLTGSGFAHLSYLFAMPNEIAGKSVQGLLIYFLFLTQFNDVLQFIWGTLFGKHFISPEISPKKTWEGLIGALFTSMLIAVGLRMLTPFSIVQSAIIGFMIPFFGFWGDLAISSLKRNLKVKDLGAIIPGHGGILDRVDSILLASIVYFYLILFWF